ncbi:hypothetical protein B4U80_01134 [Leptotrombidium deliense]|uniref:GDT1 family protein n=1 Tax=Leptotrombidium deliense TaxID=299467 RepID=A0A443S3F3_9ACAR|nr:hypothetical protein B4U80_01134 [Leptotrombidium deliense]
MRLIRTKPVSGRNGIMMKVLMYSFVVSLSLLFLNVCESEARLIPDELSSNLTQKVKDVKINGKDSSEESSEEVNDETDIWHRFGKTRFIHAFLAALSLIIGMELGDKTFFIAAIMSMRHSRWTIFMAAISALIVMTLLSVFLGCIANLIPRALVHYLSILLFLIFGIKMIRDGYVMSDEEAKEEFEEVNKELAKREAVKTEDIEYSLSPLTEDVESGVLKTIKPLTVLTRIKRKLLHYISLIFIETFVMTFVAEWGDRSQIATIALAANHDLFAVTLGAIIGHSLCTGLAVLGGRFIAQTISVRNVTIVGGIIFVFFAFLALFMGQHEETAAVAAS